MTLKTRVKEVFEKDTSSNTKYYAPTIGTVVDANDPQQNHRVRVVCPAWGETYNNDVANVPWAIHISQFMGTTEVGTRGPDLTQTSGPVAYGLWAVPKVGASVLVFCVDGDPEHRVVAGCLPPQLAAHTMPHGRWTYDDHPAVQLSGDQRPFGPISTTESAIEPLNGNMRQAFSNKNEPNYEWRTRAADYSVSAVDIDHLDSTYSKVADDKDVSWDNWNSRQGYQSSRLAPHQATSTTQRNFDSLVYALTSPGFHAFSMDDRQENCRIRVRTTSGHQIILDDTNERIYIATAQGRNWIEMDQAGNITAYTEGTYSVRSKGDLNFTSDETIRFRGKGIHLNSTDDVCIQSATDTNVKVGGSLKVGVTGNTLVLSTGDIGITSSGGAIDAQASGQIGLKSSLLAVANSMVLAGGISMSGGITSTGTSGGSGVTMVGNLNMIGTLQVTNSVIASSMFSGGHPVQTSSSSGPSPSVSPPSVSTPSVSPSAPNERQAMWPSMVPDHEPWARTMTKNDYTDEPEVPYTSPQVGRIARGRTIMRGRFWRR